MRILYASAFVAAALFRIAVPHSSPLPQTGDGGGERFVYFRARLARDIMRDRGYDVAYVETPEGHNWSNWRGRLRELLTAFWGKR